MNLKLKETQKEYYLLVNRPELLRRARELGYENAVLMMQEELDAEDDAMIRSMGKPVFRVTYIPEEDNQYSLSSRRFIPDSNIHEIHYELSGVENPDGTVNDSLETALIHFPEPEMIEKRLANIAIIRETDHTGRCGNCHKTIKETDRYCRNCGTVRGGGKFEPFYNMMYCVYGPPVKKSYRCSACGNSFTTSCLGGIDDVHYCPQCGALIPEPYHIKTLDWSELETMIDECDDDLEEVQTVD